MTAPASRSAPAFDPARVPLRIGRVALRVRDLDSVAAFYRRVLGLTVLEQAAARVTLGTPAAPLIDLHAAPDAPARAPHAAGLFHTAFLVPDRAALGRWLAHAGAAGVRIGGASDHLVSEALYLSDPEGNGIEIYADRPASGWRDGDGRLRMATEPLDLPGLLAAAGGARAGLPEGTTVGHVHLQVGDTGAADAFYGDILGLEVTSRYPGASFYGSGGYHHHLAGNVWHSRGAGRRPESAAGLAQVEIVARDAATRAAILARAAAAGVPVETGGPAPVLRDPWGTALALAA